MFAYIPARKGSKRLPKKNIKQLDGKPMICHVIEQLQNVAQLDGIAVSTDCEDTQQLVSAYNSVVTLDLRSPELAQDDTTFIDLVKHDVDRFSAHFGSSDLLFCLPTAVLIDSQTYQRGISIYQQQQDAVAISLVELKHEVEDGINEQDFLFNITDQKLSVIHQGEAINSKQPIYADAGGFYIFNAEQTKSLARFIDNPVLLPIVLAPSIGLDINNPQDWKQLEARYQQLKTN
jgi:CMP-N-acetylneuraminic acid synthetase